MRLNIYILEDADLETDGWITYDFYEAQEEARRRRKKGEKVAVIAEEYEYSDSALVDLDVAVWPPV